MVVDADKTSYITYLELILSFSEPGSTNCLLRPGGVIIADNILRRGLVADHSQANPYNNTNTNRGKDREVIDEINKKMKSDKRLDDLLLPVFDGLGMARLVD